MDNSIKLYNLLSCMFCTIIVTGNLIFQKFIKIDTMFLEFEISVGVLLYPATFLISDLVTEFYGKNFAHTMIKNSVLCSIFVMLLIMIGDYFPATSWSNINDEDFSRIFNIYIIASCGSIIATYTAQSVDVQIFSYLKKLTNSKHLWLRNNFSTMIAQVIDTSLVLTILSIAQIISWSNYIKIASSSIGFKLIASIILTPIFYLSCFIVKKLFSFRFK